MDWIASKETILEIIKKYRYIALVLLLGIFLMMLPDEQVYPESAGVQVEVSNKSLEESLSELLSLVSGAGKVRVLLTQAAGEEYIYQTDGTLSSDSGKGETVIISGGNREEAGLVRQVHPPVYRGALVLCQGADQAGVRLAITEAVTRVTGLTSDKIAVLKMK